MLLDQFFMGNESDQTIVDDFDKKLDKMHSRLMSFDSRNAKELWHETKKTVTSESLKAELDLHFAYHATCYTNDFGNMDIDFTIQPVVLLNRLVTKLNVPVNVKNSSRRFTAWLIGWAGAMANGAVKLI